jgi:hypothetical protein
MAPTSGGRSGGGGGQVAGGAPPGTSQGAVNAPTKPPKPLTAGRAQFEHGLRKMRLYQVTSGEIAELSTLGKLTTLFVAVGTFLAGVTWDVGLTLNTANLETAKSSFLAGLQLPTGIGAVACLVLAVGLAIWRAVRTKDIKDENHYDVTR